MTTLSANLALHHIRAAERARELGLAWAYEVSLREARFWIGRYWIGRAMA